MDIYRSMRRVETMIDAVKQQSTVCPSVAFSAGCVSCTRLYTTPTKTSSQDTSARIPERRSAGRNFQADSALIFKEKSITYRISAHCRKDGMHV